MMKLGPADAALVRYAAYAKAFQWTPQQVGELTIEQDDYLLQLVATMRKAEQKD